MVMKYSFALLCALSVVHFTHADIPSPNKDPAASDITSEKCTEIVTEDHLALPCEGCVVRGDGWCEGQKGEILTCRELQIAMMRSAVGAQRSSRCPSVRALRSFIERKVADEDLLKAATRLFLARDATGEETQSFFANASLKVREGLIETILSADISEHVSESVGRVRCNGTECIRFQIALAKMSEGAIRRIVFERLLTLEASQIEAELLPLIATLRYIRRHDARTRSEPVEKELVELATMSRRRDRTKAMHDDGIELFERIEFARLMICKADVTCLEEIVTALKRAVSNTKVTQSSLLRIREYLSALRKAVQERRVTLASLPLSSLEDLGARDPEIRILVAELKRKKSAEPLLERIAILFVIAALCFVCAARNRKSDIESAMKFFALPPNADLDQLRRRYFALAKACHPDRVGDGEPKMDFVSLSKAYQHCCELLKSRAKQ